MKGRLFIYLFIANCESTKELNHEGYLKGKTFLRLTKSGNKDVLFLSCAANLPKLRFSDVFYEDIGQEQSEFDNWYIKNETKNTLEIVYSSNGSKEVSSIIKLDSLNSILVYNGYLYMDSIQAIKLPIIIEECEKCYEIAVCNQWKKTGKWNDFITSQIPLEYITNEQLNKTNLTFFDKELIKQWQGQYSFVYGRTRMGVSSQGGMRFYINGENN